MSKDNKRLREGLKNLFKARGEETTTNKKPKTNEISLKQKTEINGDLKKSKIKIPKDIKAKNDTNEMGKQKIKFKTANSKETKNFVDKKIKKQNGKISKDEHTGKSETQQTNTLPPGYFVRNPNAEEQKIKKKMKSNKKQQKLPVETKNVKENEKSAKKRKPQQQNGPKNKKSKVPHKSKEEIEEETENLNETSYSYGNGVWPYENSRAVSTDYDNFSDLDAINTDDEFDIEEETDSTGTECSEECSDEDFYDSDFEASDYDDDSSDEYLSHTDDDDNEFENYDYSGDFHDGDPDYMLPKDVLEDLIIHKGLAVKHNLSSKHEVNFDESIEDGQIVELPHTSPVKTIKQHEAYDIEYLRSLELKFFGETIEEPKLNQESEEECPELVPVDDVNFRLWTSGISMDDKIFSESEDYIDSDEESITVAEGNINKKYLKDDFSASEDDEEFYDYMDEDYDNDDEEEFSQKSFKMKADIIFANQADCSLKNPSLLSQESFTEQSLSDIIAQTENLIDPTKIVIKSATVIPAVVENDLNMSIEAPETIRCAPVETNLIPFDELNSPRPILDADSDIEMPEIIENPTNNTSKSPQTAAVTTPAFNTQFFNSLDAHQVLVLLKTPFSIYGTVKVTLIGGIAEIYGYKLEKWTTHQLFSPRGCCALQIRAITTSETSVPKSILAEEILATIGTYNDVCEFQANDLDRLLAAYNPSTDAILLMSRNDEAENIKRMLQQHVNENIFPPQISLSRSLYTTESLLDCIINITAEYPLHIPQDWLKFYMNSTSKYLLVGGKSVGKSTLLRYLLNSHLNKFPKILLIDLDIGQPEIFTSQAVSCALIDQPLLGPGFMYGIQPDKAFVVAHYNIQLCAHQYMLAVIELLQSCHAEPRYRDIPWIVNTMGYNKGFGAELISVITEHLRPTDIVQLQSNVSINNFDFLFESNILPTIERHIYYSQEYKTENPQELNYRLHVLSTAVQQQSRYQREWQMSAKDMRYIMLVTHLSQLLTENGEILNQEKTYCRDLKDFHIVSLIPNGISATETLKSANANLVYLCRNEGNTKEGSKAEKIECFGIGIVRGIDFHVGKIYILTALQFQRLTKVNCLALSEMPLPATLLTLQNAASDSNVPFVQNVSDEATSRAIRQFYYRT